MQPSHFAEETDAKQKPVEEESHCHTCGCLHSKSLNWGCWNCKQAAELKYRAQKATIYKAAPNPASPSNSQALLHSFKRESILADKYVVVTSHIKTQWRTNSHVQWQLVQHVHFLSSLMSTTFNRGTAFIDSHVSVLI